MDQKRSVKIVSNDTLHLELMKTTSLSLSTAEAEYIAVVHASKSAGWL